MTYPKQPDLNPELPSSKRITLKVILKCVLWALNAAWRLYSVIRVVKKVYSFVEEYLG